MNYQQACQYINTAAAIERLDDDRELYIDLLESFFGNSPADFAVLEGLIESGSYEDAAFSIHKLKGASGTLGAEKLYTLCLEAEQMLKKRKAPPAELLREIRDVKAVTFQAFRIIMDGMKAEIQSC